MADRLKTGQIGENIAKGYLENKGYKIAERNYKTKYAEIDLIGIRQGVMVFFEVRTKRGEVFGSPEDTLNWAKLRKVSANAQAYMAFKKWTGPCRIDAICIVLGEDDKAKRIDHYENIV
jgi:putative endonuclease